MNKHLGIAIGLMLLGASAAQAGVGTLCGEEKKACPLELITPNAASMPCAQTTAQLLTFTLVNHTGITIPIEDIDLFRVAGDTSPGSTVVLTNLGTCHGSIPVQGCTIIVSVTPPSGANCAVIPQEIMWELDVDTDVNQGPLSGDITVEITAPVLRGIIVAGGTTSAKEKNAGDPYFVAYDYLEVWQEDSLATNASGNFQANSSACTGVGANALCSLATTYDGTVAPVAQISQDGGKTWHAATLPGIPTNSTLVSTACSSGNSGNPVCIVAGTDNTLVAPAALYYSSVNNGTTWSFGTASFPNSFLNGSACAGDSASFACIAVGGELTNPSHPTIFVHTTAGHFGMNLVGSTGSFFDAACTMAEGKAVCVAAGITDPGTAQAGIAASGAAQLFVNPDTITHPLTGWVPAPVAAAFPAHSTFTSVDCATHVVAGVEKAMCAVVGQPSGGTPLLMVTTDAGNTGQNWVSALPVLVGSIYLELNSVSCATSSSNVMACVAAGAHTPSRKAILKPLLLTSTTGITSWNLAPDLFPGGILAGSACTPNGTQMLCSVVGDGGDRPELFVNSDVLGAGTWATPVDVPLPSDGGLKTTAVANGG